MALLSCVALNRVQGFPVLNILRLLPWRWCNLVSSSSSPHSNVDVLAPSWQISSVAIIVLASVISPLSLLWLVVEAIHTLLWLPLLLLVSISMEGSVLIGFRVVSSVVLVLLVVLECERFREVSSLQSFNLCFYFKLLLGQVVYLWLDFLWGVVQVVPLDGHFPDDQELVPI
jgi:hypothetical protein